MTYLVLGMILFVGIHSTSIVSPAGRDRLVARLGEGGWKGLYSLVALAGLALIVHGYGAARTAPTLVWAPPTGLRHASLLLLVPVFPLLLAAYLPGRIQAAAKHPMLAATKLWAFSHLLANGMLADLVLFGGILAWAVADRISLERRAVRPIPMAPAGKANDVIAVVGGLALYVAFVLGLHEAITGVAPVG